MVHYNNTVESVLKSLNTTRNGLSEEEVIKRQGKCGMNRIPGQKKAGLLKFFFTQFLNPLIYVLLIASVVTIVLEEYNDAIFIAVALLLNAVIGTIQEFKAEKSAAALQHLEHVLQNWVAYFIIPVFAFFNAGVAFSSEIQPDINLVTALAMSLFLGKSFGIMLLSFASVKLKFTSLPEGVSLGQIAGVSILAGVGFTMSMFIANLAFADASTTHGFGKNRNTGRFTGLRSSRVYGS